jgi:UPF0716 protein FxsA
MMAGRLLILFLVVPLVELYLLLKFSSVTSIPTTIAVVVLTGVCGSILAAKQGASAIRNFQLTVSQGKVPGGEVIDGILIAFAAALLLTPGLLTDSMGILLLIPWSRQLFRRWLIRRYAGRFKVVSYSQGPHSDGGPGDRHEFDKGTVDASFRPKTNDPPNSYSTPRI